MAFMTEKFWIEIAIAVIGALCAVGILTNKAVREKGLVCGLFKDWQYLY